MRKKKQEHETTGDCMGERKSKRHEREMLNQKERDNFWTSAELPGQ